MVLNPIYHIIIATIVCLSSSSMRGNSIRTLEQDEWLSACIAPLAPQELQLIANVLYISWQRQELTDAVQDAALTMLDASWRSWHAIAYTRRNPSHTMSDDIIPQKLAATHNHFNKLYERYRTVNSTYDKMLTLLAEQQEKQSMQDALSMIKHQGRLATINILRTAIDLFHHESTQSFELLQKVTLQLPVFSVLSSKNIITDVLAMPMAMLIIQSFAISDNKYVMTSSRCWQALLASQQASNTLWRALARTRAQFYKKHYSHVYHTMKQQRLACSNFQLMFDYNGYIVGNKHKKMLPNPT